MVILPLAFWLGVAGVLAWLVGFFMKKSHKIWVAVFGGTLASAGQIAVLGSLVIFALLLLAPVIN